ncbi:tyrosine-type recombinase/integrase [Bradyrhizobium elkanii]|uniref:Integrase n=1 Tax=Bradyrhizobium elkanii TaxID=29448 RepID=A0ABV4FA92_BRAEL|nr:site-specific integrase [Bradyrhizobium elkanii]MCP1751949.1 integrase [Bradyrhizobium elkanii]MCP1977720.1 integrase [Bradyrhizobium elkanii]MCS3887763.1 integrase [Bradyrhizobium elkanii]MCS4213218.1 integrase [Bradyrhizobium elkanii]MCW2213525.1 integrase [Bradyrhizobium elkanii]
MAKMAFSDVGLRSISPPPKGQICYWDDKLPSFGFRVSQGGSKTFVLNRKNSLITIGRFPTISLSQARTEAKRLLAEFTLGKVRPQSITYSEAVTLFLEEKAKARRGSTVSGYKGLLNSITLSGQLSQITHQEVQRKLAKFKTEGAYNHHLVALTVFFNWCRKRRYVTDNPTLGLSTHRRPSRNRILSDDELKSIWRACEQGRDASQDVQLSQEGAAVPAPLPATFCKLVQLLILTGQRRNEIASLQLSWITDNAITLPPNVTKNGREHTVPLGKLSVSILEKCHTNQLLLFPARGSTTSPFSGWSTTKKALDILCGVEAWTLHDLRRTYRSIHGKIGTPPHIAERLVNHISAQSEMERTYDRYAYLNEMHAAVETYEQYLLQNIVG